MTTTRGTRGRSFMTDPLPVILYPHCFVLARNKINRLHSTYNTIRPERCIQRCVNIDSLSIDTLGVYCQGGCDGSLSLVTNCHGGELYGLCDTCRGRESLSYCSSHYSQVKCFKWSTSVSHPPRLNYILIKGMCSVEIGPCYFGCLC